MEKSVDYRGGRIKYKVSGKGDPVILLHGYLESLSVFDDFGILLSDRFRVIAIDLPGNGGSSLYKDEHTMCFLADAVIAVLDNEEVSWAVVLGHSLRLCYPLTLSTGTLKG
ncbi:MAG: alpha/beta fold hydrolase [Bacteroidales bacterium]